MLSFVDPVVFGIAVGFIGLLLVVVLFNYCRRRDPVQVDMAEDNQPLRFVV